MKLEHFAQMRALESAYTSTNQRFVDLLLSDPKTAENMPLKRIQFDTWEGLAEELDKVCELLDCSKRQFLEGAVVEALDKAKTIYFATLNRVADDVGGPQYSLNVVEEAA